jgi:hypothetical protein
MAVRIEKLEFFHDKRFKKPFNLFEDLRMRDVNVDIENRKIKIEGWRKRKFNIISGSNGQFHAEFTVNNVKYYMKVVHNNKTRLYC